MKRLQSFLPSSNSSLVGSAFVTNLIILNKVRTELTSFQFLLISAGVTINYFSKSRNHLPFIGWVIIFPSTCHSVFPNCFFPFSFIPVMDADQVNFSSPISTMGGEDPLNISTEFKHLFEGVFFVFWCITVPLYIFLLIIMVKAQYKRVVDLATPFFQICIASSIIDLGKSLTHLITYPINRFLLKGHINLPRKEKHFVLDKSLFSDFIANEIKYMFAKQWQDKTGISVSRTPSAHRVHDDISVTLLNNYFGAVFPKWGWWLSFYMSMGQPYLKMYFYIAWGTGSLQISRQEFCI